MSVALRGIEVGMRVLLPSRRFGRVFAIVRNSSGVWADVEYEDDRRDEVRLAIDHLTPAIPGSGVTACPVTAALTPALSRGEREKSKSEGKR